MGYLHSMCMPWQDEREYYGIDWDGPIPQDDDDDDNVNYDGNGMIVVPQIESPLDEACLDELSDEVLPLADTTSYGIDLYEKTLDFVSLKLNILL